MKIFHIIFLLISFDLLGQIGINTSLPLANLDIQAVNSDSDGILIPIVNTFSSNSPNEDQNSMLVFYDNDIYGYSGFYWWDNDNNIWQYIFQSKMIEMNLFRIITKTSRIDNIPAGIENNNVWFKSTLSILEAPNANYKLLNGELVIGKTGLYSINFNGQVGKFSSSASSTMTEVGLFINDNSSPDYLSSTPLPSADNGNRYATHSISGIRLFNQGDRISIKTRRTSNVNTTFNYSENYTLILSAL